MQFLKKQRDDRVLRKWVSGLFLAIFTPLFLLAWVAAYDLLSQAIQFDLFGWFDAEGEASESASKPNEPTFGFAALIATSLSVPFIIWRSWVAHEDYKVKEQGHITDRINKAVEGLGAEKTVKQVVKEETKEFTQPNLEVRIGSIYALERIAQDSLRDHIQIMEILCAYIRENAPSSQAIKDSLVNKESIKPRIDIQVALTVIGRRSGVKFKFNLRGIEVIASI